MNAIRATLLGLWLGAALFFSAVVAPKVFAVLRAADVSSPNQVAGSIVTRTLAVINLGGLLIALLLLLTFLVQSGALKRGLMMTQVICLLLMAITTAVGHWGVAARMVALRASMLMPIDQVAWNDPRRVEFNHLHG